MTSPPDPLDPNRIKGLIDVEGDVTIYEDPNSFTVTVSVPPISDGEADTLQQVLNNQTEAQINVEVEIRTTSKWVSDEPEYNVDTSGTDKDDLAEAIRKESEDIGHQTQASGGGGGGSSYKGTVAAGGGGGGGTFKMPTNKFKLGQEVLVKNRDGTKVKGVVVDQTGKTAEEVYVQGQPLDEYWEDGGYSISPTERVYTVDLDGASTGPYDYPESQITRLKDITDDTEVDSAADTTFEVARVCPVCEDHFQKTDDSSIEGDEGELYCSLDCLNEAYT